MIELSQLFTVGFYLFFFLAIFTAGFYFENQNESKIHIHISIIWFIFIASYISLLILVS